MKTKVVLMSVVLLGMASVTVPIAQTNSQSASDQLSQEEALKLVRVIITAETELPLIKKPYVSLEELLQTRFFQKGIGSTFQFLEKKSWSQTQINLIDSTSASLNNYYLSVIASVDGNHYQVRLAPERGCDVALFANEAAVIYKGKGLGCQSQ